MTQKRVNIPEIKALIAELNTRYFNIELMPIDDRRMFRLPDSSLRQIVILEFKPHPEAKKVAFVLNPTSPIDGWVYEDTHVFDLPKEAKVYLVKRLDTLAVPHENMREGETGNFQL
ncbi:MAG: hypothetical protein ACXAC8_12515 [Candidatus Hodarchaeales archaeon]